MEKEKTFTNTRFSAEVLQEAATVIRQIASEKGVKLRFHSMVEQGEEKWTNDTSEEYIAASRAYKTETAYFSLSASDYNLTVWAYPQYAGISFKTPSRITIERVFDVFEKNVVISKLPPLPSREAQVAELTVFIGHGRSSLWRELKDHLQDKHGVKVIAFETGARAGHSIRDILEEMVSKSTFALLVFTAGDEQVDGEFRARQNVVHEAGLFQGRLGFSRAIMVLEDGTEDFSNVAGIQQLRFSKGNIKEVFGDVIAVIRREFGNV